MAEEIVIAGAGPVGLALALALARGGRTPRLYDARPAGAAAHDARVLALSHGSRQILERLGAWPGIAATPIRSIHVSQQGGFGRTVIRATDHDLPALGYVAEASGVSGALEAALAEAGVRPVCDTRIEQEAPGDDDIIVSLSGAEGAATVATKLVCHAEGAAQGEAIGRDYRQQAVIAVAETAAPHRNLAYERFTAGGPVALLPYGSAYALVWTAADEAARDLLALHDDAFLARLQQQFGTRLRFTRCGPRRAFPLALRMRRQPTAPRSVWLGNAAQTLHPVAGQGYNLALRDVWQLCELLREGGDPGSPALLARYAAARRLDRYATAGFTDGLIRLFGGGNPLLAAARGSGLALLDLLPPAREFLARRMMFGARAWP
jgi:2-octaprenyl-6-methoxyphenol hydroxylase